MKTQSSFKRADSARKGGPQAIRNQKLVLRRILVAVDFSGHSRKALNYAVAMATQHQGRISLVHVVELPSMVVQPVVGGGLGSAAQEREGLVKHARKELAELAAKTIPQEAAGHALVRVGVAYDEIIRTARKLHMDLIVVGTHGTSGLKRMVAGSTAERVVRYAPCPVLTVRDVE